VTARLLSADPDKLYEVVNGVEVEIPHMGFLAGTVASLLAYYINSFAIPRQLGVATSEVLFQLRPDSPQRRPDLAFVPYALWPPIADLDEDPPAFVGVPAIAIEVLSKRNTALEIEEKLIEYLEAGVQLVWVVHPKLRRIYVHRSPSDVHVLNLGDKLEGGSVLPGFTLPLQELFAALQPPA
jgi:Uma2 family endonuclease